MNKKYSVILIAILIVLTGATALSAHLLFIQYFTPPVINIDPKLNQMVGFIIRFATVIGAILIYHLSKKYWIKLRLFYRVILFALLVSDGIDRAIVSLSLNGVSSEWRSLGIPNTGENAIVCWLLNALPTYKWLRLFGQKNSYLKWIPAV